MLNLKNKHIDLLGNILIYLQIFYNVFDNKNSIEKLKKYAIKMCIINLVNGTIKTSIKRERPNKKNLYSFPSSHTSNTIITATTLYLHNKKHNNIVNLIFPIIIIYSRILSLNHYSSDVFAGFLISKIFNKIFDRLEKNIKI